MFEVRLDTGSQSLMLLVYCNVDDMLFEVAQTSAVPVSQVATVVMKTTQLLLSQFKNFYRGKMKIA